MKNMKVAVKLLVGFMIVTLLSVVLAGVGIFANQSLNGDYEYLLENPIDRERSLAEMHFLAVPRRELCDGGGQYRYNSQYLDASIRRGLCVVQRSAGVLPA